MKPLFLFLFPCALLFLGGCTSSQVHTAFEEHEAKYPDIRKKYIYQSVIRLANLKGNPDFNKLIKDVHNITIYLPPSGDSTYQIHDLATHIQNDGYEQLFEVRTADSGKVSLWMNEKQKPEQYMGFLDVQQQHIIFRIDGQLDLNYISAISGADQSSLLDLVK